MTIPQYSLIQNKEGRFVLSYEERGRIVVVGTYDTPEEAWMSVVHQGQHE